MQRATDQQDSQHGCGSWLSQVKIQAPAENPCRASDQQDGQHGCGGWLSQVKIYKHFLWEITPELTKHAGYRYTKCKHAVLTSYIGHSYNYIHPSS